MSSFGLEQGLVLAEILFQRAFKPETINRSNIILAELMFIKHHRCKDALCFPKYAYAQYIKNKCS